ncbi:hypothetical protein BDK51DRAFT_43625 [Blyttiomyces helicus]|uniref:Uncharacterized protein n=1 Tax=Blyttiomyces helicus TaxID=388810 RepID=A0A4P9WHD6_9FUNG|nr:hypothetical protein BDK51DRAFT_43625 [Blyttiomyces helicus]|eukprot:RKO91792.1 hypothetical protein BDK51DRAFT_43625 [Blyttiomyces helicus]
MPVLLLDPFPLTAHPFAVDLPQNSGSVAATKKSPASKPPPAFSASSPPAGFFVAAVPESAPAESSTDSDSNHPYVVATVQGGGVYLYQLETQQCLHSRSVPPGLLFASPARFIPNSATPPEPQGDADENAERPIASVTGNLYAAIAEGKDVPAKHGGRLVWMWEVGARAEAKKEVKAGAKAGKPDAVKLLDRKIHSLFTADVSTTSPATPNLVALHTDASVTLLTRTLTQSAFVPAPSATFEVLWSKMDDSSAGVVRLVALSRNTKKPAVHVVRSVVIGGADGNRVEWERELKLQGPETSGPVAFEYVADGEKLVVACEYAFDSKKNLSRGSVLFWAQSHIYGASIRFKRRRPVLQPRISIGRNASDNGVVEKRETGKGGWRIAFSVENRNIVDGNALLSVFASQAARSSPPSLAVIDSTYLAIIGPRQSKTKPTSVEQVLTVWDTSYGTLQAERVLEGGDEERMKIFTTSSVSTSQYGKALAISSTTVLSSNPLSFRSTITLCPHHCPPLSLLSTLGRLPHPTELPQKSSLHPPKREGDELTAADREFRVQGLGLSITGPKPPPTDPDALAAWVETLDSLDAKDRAFLRGLFALPMTKKFEPEFETRVAKWIRAKIIEAAPVKEAVEVVDAEIDDAGESSEMEGIEVEEAQDVQEEVAATKPKVRRSRSRKQGVVPDPDQASGEAKVDLLPSPVKAKVAPVKAKVAPVAAKVAPSPVPAGRDLPPLIQEAADRKTLLKYPVVELAQPALQALALRHGHFIVVEVSFLRHNDRSDPFRDNNDLINRKLLHRRDHECIAAGAGESQAKQVRLPGPKLNRDIVPGPCLALLKEFLDRVLAELQHHASLGGRSGSAGGGPVAAPAPSEGAADEADELDDLRFADIRDAPQRLFDDADVLALERGAENAA